MDCAQVRNALFDCDSPTAATLPPTARAHVEECAACRQLLDEIAILERVWREQPLPPGCDEAKNRFLQTLEATTTSARPTDVVGRRMPRWRWMVAASILFVAIGSAWLAMPPRDTTGYDVLDRLVDWNLAIADAPDGLPADIISRQRDDLKKLVQSAPLSDDDRELAESMLDAGPFLATNHDPLAAADRFEAIAEKMQKRGDLAAAKGNSPEFGRWAMRFGWINEHGIKPQLDFSKKFEMQQKQKQEWEKLAAAYQKRKEAFVHTAERHPEMPRPDFGRAGHGPPGFGPRGFGPPGFGPPGFGPPGFGRPPFGMPPAKKGAKGKS